MLIKVPHKYAGPLKAVLNELNLPRHIRELARNIRNHRYEAGEGKVVVPGMGFGWHGQYYDAVQCSETGVITELERFDNTHTEQGLNHMLDITFGGGTQNTTWYIAISSTNATPTTSWTAADYASNATEITTGYDEATRQEWVDAPASGTIKSTTTRSTFTANGVMTVFGNGLLSSNVKGGTAGVLAGAALRASSVPIPDGDTYLAGFDVDLNFA